MTTPNDLPSVGTEDAPLPKLPYVQATAPERIFLVIGEDTEPDTNFRQLEIASDTITWCEDKIDDNSIPYVREDRVVSERDALAGRVAELEAALKPNLFWNDADPEHGETSIFEVIDSEWNGGCMKHGDEMVIQQAVRLPNIRVRLIPCPTDGDDYFDYEVIDAALSATTPESKP